MRISDWSSDVCSSDLVPAWVVSRAQTFSDLRGLVPISCMQLEYSLVQRSIEREHIPLAQAHDIGITAWAPQIGRASCRERVCPYVSISVVAVSLKKKKHYRHSKIRQIRDKINQ